MAKQKQEVVEQEIASEEVQVEVPAGLSPKARRVDCTPEKAEEYQKKGKLAGYNDQKGYAWIIPAIILSLSIAFGGVSFAAESTDEAVLGNNRWSVQNDGDIVPNANTYNIGSSTNYPASIWVNGAQYSSFAAGTDGNWTNGGLTTTLDAAPTKFIATHSSGDFFATGFTVDTGDITFGQGGKIDGDTNGTIKLIEASDTLSFIFSGTTIQLDSSDGGIQFAMADASEGYVDILANGDADDYIRFSTVANVPTIVTAGTSNLEIAPDGGTTTVTGALTSTGLATAAGVTTSSTITLQNSETIVNSTNGTVQVGGATNTILSVFDTGTSDSDATVQLVADAGGDAADTWKIISDGATNGLIFDNAGSTVFTIPSTGIITLSAALTLSNGELLSNATDDTVRIASDDASLAFDIYTPNATNGTSALNLIGDAGADATDRFQFLNSANGTLTIGNDSSAAGTYIAKATLDSTGAFTVQGSEATAGSIAIWSDNGDDAADKVTFSVADAGALTLTTGANTLLTGNADGSTTFGGDVGVSGTTPLVTIGDGGDEDTGIQINSDTNDFYIASENSADDLVIGLGSAIGTTPIISMTDVGHTTVTGSTDGILTVWGAGTTASDAYLRLVGDAQTDASDSFQAFYDSSAATLYLGIDDTTPGTYITKASLDSTGAFTVQGSEATAGSIAIWSDNGDDAIDKVTLSVADGGAMTYTTGAVTAMTISAAGLVNNAASTTLGDAITDVTTFTGKVAGATPMSFDGVTADTVYTIFAMDDPASSSKTITFPAVTGQVMLASASTALTPGAAVTLTIGDGYQVYTDTITTDNQDQTITFSGAGAAGDEIMIIFTTDSGGSGDEVITFETTLTQSEGTLTLANLTAGQYVVCFRSNGTVWIEKSRTAALS